MSEQRFHDFSRYVTGVMVAALVLVAIALFVFQRQVETEIRRQESHDCTARRMLVSQHNALIETVRGEPAISPSIRKVLAELQIEPQPCRLPNP